MSPLTSIARKLHGTLKASKRTGVVPFAQFIHYGKWLLRITEFGLDECLLTFTDTFFQ